jgi:hypothetical protein
LGLIGSRINDLADRQEIAPGITTRETQQMPHSPLLQQIRDEQRLEAMKLTPAERLHIALELSETCALFNTAGKKTLEAKRADTKTRSGV